MNWQASVPGKTFLFGEYSVLEGAPAVVLATGPGFSLAVTDHRQEETSQALPFHPDSPAGRLFDRHRGALERFKFQFVNRFQSGGFGASSAEFVLLARFLDEVLGQKVLPVRHFDHFEECLSVYFDHEIPEQRSSGSDVLVQWLGQSLVIERAEEKCSLLHWPWPELMITLFSTAQKIKTHEHLKSQQGQTYPELKGLARILVESLKDKNSEVFFRALRDWEETSRNLGLRLSSVLGPTDALNAVKESAAKACGAMGADVILAVHPKAQTERVKSVGHEQGLIWKFTGAPAERFQHVST